MNKKNFLDEIDLVDENDQCRQMSEEQREAVMRDYEDGDSEADLELLAQMPGRFDTPSLTLKKKKGFG